MISMASQQAYSARLVRDEIKAQALAEAGANEAYAILKADFSSREDPDAFPEKEYAGGTYDANVSPIGDDSATVVCVASVGDATATVRMDVKDFGIDDGGAAGPGPAPLPAYQCAILAGSIRWGGNGQTVTGGGDVHSQSTFEMNGTTDVFCDELTAVTHIKAVGNCTITADTTSPSYQNKCPGNITGNVTTAPVDPIPIPVLDLAPYYQYALAHGEVHDSLAAAGGSTIQPDGGIAWINGDVHLSGGASIVGCIIATGDIKVTGNCTHTLVGDFPGFISRDGDIEFTSCSHLYGLIYAPNGNIKMTGGGQITGTVICSGEFWKNGGWDAVTWADSTPPDDPAGGAAWDEDNCQVCITCWHM
jgi:hypothetical protein